jgi:hypothetical protein
MYVCMYVCLQCSKVLHLGAMNRDYHVYCMCVCIYVCVYSIFDTPAVWALRIVSIIYIGCLSVCVYVCVYAMFEAFASGRCES